MAEQPLLPNTTIVELGVGVVLGLFRVLASPPRQEEMRFMDDQTKPLPRARFGYNGAAEYTGLSRRQLERAVRNGRLACLKPSGPTGPVRFTQEQLDSFLARIEVPAVVTK